MRHSTATVASLLAACIMLGGGHPVEASEGYGGPYASPSLSVSNVEIATVTRWLGRFGIDVPITLQGRASASLTVGVPVFAPGRAAAYRLDGSLTSARLVVAGIELRDVALTLRYRDGVMQLLPLSFRVLDPHSEVPDATSGAFTGRASLQLIPRGKLSLGLVVGRVPVAPLARQIAGLPELGSGAIAGSLSADVPLDDATTAAAWRARGRIALDGWRLFGRTLAAASATFNLRDARLAVSEITGQLEGVRLAGDGTLNLAAPFGYMANLAAAADRLTDLQRLLGDAAVPDSIVGQPAVSAQISGTLNPFVYEARAEAAVREFRYEELALESVRLAITATPQRIAFSDLDVTPHSGRVETRLSAEVPPAEIQRLAAWKADLEFLAENWSIGTRSVRAAQGALRVADGRLTVSQLRVEADTVELEASGAAALTEPFDFDVRADARLAQLSSLADFHPQLTWLRNATGAAEIDADLHGTGQPFDYQGRADVRLSDVHAGTLAVRSAGLTLTADENWLQVGNLSLVPERGRFDGELDARVPKDRLGDLAAWQLTGSVELADWSVVGHELRSATLEVRLADGRLSVPRLTAELDSVSANGSAQVSLADEFDFTAELGLRVVDLAAAAALAPELDLPDGIAGRAEFDATTTGTLRPLTFEARGRAAVHDATLADLSFDSAETAFQFNRQQLGLDDLVVKAYGGELTGRAVLPLDAMALGSADLAWRDIDLGRLAGELADLPVPLAGIGAGQLELRLPAAADEQGWRDWSLETTFAASEVALGPVAVGDLRGEASRRDGLLAYEAGGDLLGGRIYLSGRWSVEAADAAAGTDEGQLVLTGVELGRLMSRPGAESPLRASLDADLTFQHTSAAGPPSVSGTVTLADVRWDNVLLAERLEARARFDGSELTVDPLTGNVAGGTLRLVSRGVLVPQPAQSFELTLRDGELDRLLAPWPDMAGEADGRVDVVLRGVLRDGVQVEGRVTVPRTQVAGQRLSSLRVPVRLAFDPRRGTADLRLSDMSADAVGGRVSGHLNMTIGRTLDLDGSAKFTDVDTEDLFGRHVFLGDGRISGSIVVTGRRVRSFADIDARIEARLRQTRARSLPLVEVIQPYLTSRIAAGEIVETGDLRARLRRGVVTVERFALDAESFQLLARGTLVPGGRMDLDVMVHTRPSGPNRFVGQILLDRLPPVGPPPLMLATQANRWLSNRVIHLSVTGTTSRPAVRVEALRMLEEEALRFFLGSLAR